MRVEFLGAHPSPSSVRDLLEAHRLLPDSLREPLNLILYSNNCSVCVIGDDVSNPDAMLLSNNIEPNVLHIYPIVRNKTLFMDRNATTDINLLLHAKWLSSGIRRLESRLPAELTNSVRFLRAIGFKQETAPSGIRSALSIGGKYSNIHILGMLPGDRPKLIKHGNSDTVCAG